MRLTTLLTVAALLLTTAPLLAPHAAAAPCDVNDVRQCVKDICVFSFYNDPDCIVRNPCDPRYCDVHLPDPSILDPVLP